MLFYFVNRNGFIFSLFDLDFTVQKYGEKQDEFETNKKITIYMSNQSWNSGRERCAYLVCQK